MADDKTIRFKIPDGSDLVEFFFDEEADKPKARFTPKSKEPDKKASKKSGGDHWKNFFKGASQGIIVDPEED